MAQAKRKINQSDLRRLMKERKENFASDEKNIESPLAKYDSAGRLSCTACNEVISVGMLWRQHILSKSHKKNLTERLKRKHAHSDISVSQNAKKERLAESSEKPSSHMQPPINVDKSHIENVNKLGTTPISKAGVGLIQEYSFSDDEENENEEMQSRSTTSQSDLPTDLPSDFFDGSGSVSHSLPPPAVTVSNEGTTKQNEGNNTKEALPEGFFDDPVLDAQARNVVYKDPMEEEWEKFQKTIAEETNLSQSIMDEDVQQSVAERNIDQIDEQMYYYGRVVALQKKAEELKTSTSSSKDNMSKEISEGTEVAQSSSSEDDERLLKELLDWRVKKMW